MAKVDGVEHCGIGGCNVAVKSIGTAALLLLLLLMLLLFPK